MSTEQRTGKEEDKLKDIFLIIRSLYLSIFVPLMEMAIDMGVFDGYCYGFSKIICRSLSGDKNGRIFPHPFTVLIKDACIYLL